ncbi:hypothetical protein AS9A_2626 [Hoyosella subflava DQS3-9A1]|uniref:Uncharacterized protein n=1 Tax=Hoyosella subflava (strain DSM 45089 / JCM 17490 / NBRC 109087 / DQS3-9A1) TaxID=443218 RepID=F6EGM0_HOYSD|nr:hypothetical protein AS9A_2626 [Hoyosella subflava DQS3-9A1]
MSLEGGQTAILVSHIQSRICRRSSSATTELANIVARMSEQMKAAKRPVHNAIDF